MTTTSRLLAGSLRSQSTMLDFQTWPRPHEGSASPSIPPAKRTPPVLAACWANEIGHEVQKVESGFRVSLVGHSTITPHVEHFQPLGRNFCLGRGPRV
jgi:hypothetical protein